jgi:hypothetical protein
VSKLSEEGGTLPRKTTGFYGLLLPDGLRAHLDTNMESPRSVYIHTKVRPLRCKLCEKRRRCGDDRYRIRSILSHSENCPTSPKRFWNARSGKLGWANEWCPKSSSAHHCTTEAQASEQRVLHGSTMFLRIASNVR